MRKFSMMISVFAVLVLVLSAWTPHRRTNNRCRCADNSCRGRANRPASIRVTNRLFGYMLQMQLPT